MGRLDSSTSLRCFEITQGSGSFGIYRSKGARYLHVKEIWQKKRGEILP